MPDTTYIVLREHDTGTWIEHAQRDASSAEAALRKTLGADQSGTYVAVPARSWKPVTVTTETRTVLKLEQPDTAA
jgi:phenylpyruvate tautomerase PptA (4-oxalocrotonate tautomerase family)